MNFFEFAFNSPWLRSPDDAVPVSPFDLSDRMPQPDALPSMASLNQLEAQPPALIPGATADTGSLSRMPDQMRDLITTPSNSTPTQNSIAGIPQSLFGASSSASDRLTLLQQLLDRNLALQRLLDASRVNFVPQIDNPSDDQPASSQPNPLTAPPTQTDTSGGVCTAKCIKLIQDIAPSKRIGTWDQCMAHCEGKGRWRQFDPHIRFPG